MDGWVDGKVDGWMDGWAEGGVDGVFFNCSAPLILNPKLYIWAPEC